MDLNGFKGLPFKFNATSKAVQYFYCKAHRVRDPHPDHCKDRTLFVINIPPYVTEDCLRRVFGKCGEIQRVFFYMKPASGDHKGEAAKYFTDATSMAGFKLAYVVFYKPEHLQNALDLNVSEPEILYDSQNLPLVGIKKWCQEYNDNFPDAEAMQAEIDKYMQDYDKRAKEKLEKEKAMEGVADEEGWITVSKHGRKPATSRMEAHSRKITTKERKKRAEKELLNFYTFQIRESKMENIAQLRKKFEEDKQRIALLKASRKFRPF